MMSFILKIIFKTYFLKKYECWPHPTPKALTETEGKPIAVSTYSHHSALAHEETKLPFKAKESVKVICDCDVIFSNIEQKKIYNSWLLSVLSLKDLLGEKTTSRVHQTLMFREKSYNMESFGKQKKKLGNSLVKTKGGFEKEMYLWTANSMHLNTLFCPFPP